MKVDHRPKAPPARSRPSPDRFSEPPKKPGALPAARTARAIPAPARVLPRGAFASAEHLVQVRQGASAEAHRLGEVRSEGQLSARERVHHRLGALLARELAREPGGPGPEAVGPTPVPVPDAPAHRGAPPLAETGRAVPASGESRVQATLALIERIEVFVKTQRPALALRLGGRLDATVEVERTGPREVSLRIQGHRGPLPPEDLTRIREALGARGLTLRTLSSA